jgi:hypothetical protein
MGCLRLDNPRWISHLMSTHSRDKKDGNIKGDLSFAGNGHDDRRQTTGAANTRCHMCVRPASSPATKAGVETQRQRRASTPPRKAGAQRRPPFLPSGFP